MAKDLSKRLYVPNPEEWHRELTKKRFFDDEPEVKVVEHGIILPARRIKGIRGLFEGGVCDSDLNFVAGYFRQKGGGGSYRFNCMETAYAVDREDILQLDEDVIFGGFLATHFGHFMIECLCRLWYVLQHPEIKSKILFVTGRVNGGRMYNTEMLELMGIEKERIIYVTKPVQCRSIIVPEQAQYDCKRLTKEFLIPYLAIKSNGRPSDHKKLYLTRTGFEFKEHDNSHIFNEKYFEDFFAARGFEIVSMEKLKVRQQLSLIMGADEIAATTGTLTHWAMFCRPDTKFIMLNRVSEDTVPIQCLINSLSNADYYIVDASKNFMYANRMLGTLLLGSNKFWKNFVADYFGEKISEDDDKAYIEKSLDEYIDFWYSQYSESKNRVIGSLKKMCTRIIMLEKELSADRPLLTYITHVSNKGWSTWKKEEQNSNPPDELQDIQAIKINFTKSFHEIYYSVFYSEAEGWSKEVSSGEMAGTIGKAKAIMGIKIRLDKTGANKFDILYRVHKFDGTWTKWAKNGEELLSQGIKLNSIQIKLEAKI
ncbi:MAG: DUF563 domain-containing protein [Selenomonadaceae bacterium]|nr:DUF563 domain-containing protein [Selenomonadaceae bacterium]